MRPVLAKLCLYESLQDGRLLLGDIQNMHDALDATAENERRARLAAKRKR